MFTPQELEELRLFDAAVDAQPFTREDRAISDFVEELLFPGRAKELEARRPYGREYSKAYYQAHKEEIKAKKAAWYQRRKAALAAELS